MLLNPPKGLFIRATFQWISLSIIKFIIGCINLVMLPIVLACSKKQPVNARGEGPNHLATYGDSLSNPYWTFFAVPLSWREGCLIKKLIWLFSNDLHGFHGNRSGFWAYTVNGAHQRTLYKVLWGLRFPAFNLFASSPLFTVDMENCDLTIYGSKKEPSLPEFKNGWDLIVATDRVTGWKYYSFRIMKLHATPFPGVKVPYTYHSIGFNISRSERRKEKLRHTYSLYTVRGISK